MVFNSNTPNIPESEYNSEYFTTIFNDLPTNGVFKHPAGADYSTLIAILPEGWIVEEF